MPPLPKQILLRGLPLLAGLLLLVVMVIALFGVRFETDIIQTLPRGNAVMSDGAYVLLNHPYQNRVFIDIHLEQKNPDMLVEAAEFVKAELLTDGVFKKVGMAEMDKLLPELFKHVSVNLPGLLTAEELENRISPLLREDVLEQRVRDNLSRLYTMEGMGQARLIMQDPLGISGVVLEKFKQIAPAEDVRFYKGHLMSPDSRHLLLVATPHSAGTGAEQVYRINDAIERTKATLERKYEDTGFDFTLTPAGAYRAALDNETTSKKDARNAILFASLGIACLLMLSFPRPYIGLLAFVPAVFGTICALAFYSIWHESISIMTIGFGGAIIAITVDHGISYLLFLDRPYETRGKNVSREVRAVALLAVLTSVSAFFMLTFSGFPVLLQIGQFAAFGIAFSFLFVHSFFPIIFPFLPPAKRDRKLPLQAVVDRLTVSGGKYKAGAALSFFVVMVFFADPTFSVDISTINTVRQETLAAEKLMADVWGQQLFDRIYVMAEARDPEALQKLSDELTARLEEDLRDNTLSQAFLPSMVYPGERRCQNNAAAWRQFWDDHDQALLHKQIGRVAAEMGLPADAFSDAYSQKTVNCAEGLTIKPDFYNLLGMYAADGSDSGGDSGGGSGSDAGSDSWLLLASLTPGDNYDAKSFFHKYSPRSNLHVFDPNYYSLAISEFLSETFTRMLVFISLCVFALLLLFFMDLVLVGAALLPLVFSMICTLGVLNLLGQPLNIPGLMLSVVVLGMGLDYSLYIVRSYQRYQDEAHPYQAHIRMAIFLAGTSTLIGFGVLAFGQHNLMKSLGQVQVLGVGFVMIGTYAILPPFLKYLFQPVRFSATPVQPGSVRHKKRFHKLYKHLEIYPRMFARLKIRLDPMFAELPALIGQPAAVVDLGCGYGVTAAWLIAADPAIKISGIEPDAERARIAARIVGCRGEIFPVGAPDLPDFNLSADLVLMLDMMHYLSDDQLQATLQNLW
ncbi:MAG: MMPL family transporter, partial [Desulfosudaceae bacterium]